MISFYNIDDGARFRYNAIKYTRLWSKKCVLIADTNGAEILKPPVITDSPQTRLFSIYVSFGAYVEC